MDGYRQIHVDGWIDGWTDSLTNYDPVGDLNCLTTCCFDNSKFYY